ncbi:hypothetical protein EX30DRAFT_171166 [Ascodesmis nigricans]|uniref:Uncharacterized protein n=1 Tax=Ascodesmis nigricans TaxID=341454 RepID=A0A4V3SHY5_9PEZI|nr:hypothetical protein EX30DRAFT_171166 [Ascodesmis nigricans]
MPPFGISTRSLILPNLPSITTTTNLNSPFMIILTSLTDPPKVHISSPSFSIHHFRFSINKPIHKFNYHPQNPKPDLCSPGPSPPSEPPSPQPQHPHHPPPPPAQPPCHPHPPSPPNPSKTIPAAISRSTEPGAATCRPPPKSERRNKPRIPGMWRGRGT